MDFHKCRHGTFPSLLGPWTRSTIIKATSLWSSVRKGFFKWHRHNYFPFNNVLSGQCYEPVSFLEHLLELQPHRGTFTMQFSYLSCSFLNHIERFGFSNTYGEMSSLYAAAIEEFKKKKKQKKANKSPRKLFSPLYLSRCSGLTFIT